MVFSITRYNSNTLIRSKKMVFNHMGSCRNGTFLRNLISDKKSAAFVQKFIHQVDKKTPVCDSQYKITQMRGTYSTL